MKHTECQGNPALSPITCAHVIVGWHDYYFYKGILHLHKEDMLGRLLAAKIRTIEIFFYVIGSMCALNSVSRGEPLYPSSKLKIGVCGELDIPADVRICAAHQLKYHIQAGNCKD